jgi:EAL domain-containing protein (putative c-di-GMP-specific phosphodiesterase class I)
MKSASTSSALPVATFNSICGCEALMRWDDPVHGRVSPEHFIPVAEQHGLIGTLTNWALQTAARELRNLPGRESHLPVAINVSPTTLFDPDLVFSIKTTLGMWNMPPQLLTLEITESVIMKIRRIAAHPGSP